MTIERINKVIEIINYAIEKNITVGDASKEFGFSSTYVKNTKALISEKHSKGKLNFDTNLYNKFIESYRKYLENKIEKETNKISNNSDINVDNLKFSINSEINEGTIEWNSNDSYPSNHIKTLDELLTACNVDLSIWDVKEYTVNKWDVTAFKNMTPKTIQNWQVKARLLKKKQELCEKAIGEFFKDMIKNYVPPILNISPKITSNNENNLLEISIFDLHYGKLAWHGETYEDYDTKIARERFLNAIKTLLHRASGFEYNKILFPIGSDFFNSDTIFNTTTKGTPQDEDLRWQKTFKTGSQLMIDAVNLLKQTGAFVDVVVIPGNHDCYSIDTEALTKNGWKKYNELLPDDLIGTINIKTKEIEYQNYSNLVIYDYNGVMFNFKNQYTDTLVSPNHRMLHRNVGCDDYQYSQAIELKNKYGYYFRLNGINNKLDYDIDDNWLKLFAWINTDGSVHKNIGFNTYTIFQSKETGCEKIENILNSLNIGFLKRIRKRNTKEIDGRILKNIPKPCYEYELNSVNTSKDKLEFINNHLVDKYEIPEILFSCSKRQVDIYVSSFIDGDGTRKNNNSTWAMIYGKEKLLSQLQILLLQNSYSSQINFYRNNQCRLYLSNGNENTRIKKNHINEINYNDKIWCLSVPNTNFITRRNGKISIQGNSERSFYLGSVLEAWFRNDNMVNINNHASPRKYYRFGKVLLGLTHGSEEKENSLPMLMASDIESKPHWSETIYHEWHLGHIHRKRNVNYTVLDKSKTLTEDLGVTVRYLSSLTGTEEWHHKKGFVGSIKAADAFIWNDNLGLIAHLNSNLDINFEEHGK